MFKKLMVATCVAVICGTAAHADVPGKHPYYLHALKDLRTARWLLNHQPGDEKVYEGEDVAIDETNKAINEIKAASIDDGKDINDHENVDVHEHGSRLLKAIETLKRAHDDIAHEEDNPEARELKHRSIEHLDHAIHAAEKAHDAWLREHGK